jgi:hypothetical protein
MNLAEIKKSCNQYSKIAIFAVTKSHELLFVLLLTQFKANAAVLIIKISSSLCIQSTK